MMEHRGEPGIKNLYELAFGKRPQEELYDLKNDPGQLANVAGDPRYAQARTALSKLLETHLRATRDPRILGDVRQFDQWE